MKYVGGAVLVVFLLFFALKNQYPVVVNLFIGEISTSLIFAMLVAFLAGLLVGAAAMSAESWKWYRQARLQEASPETLPVPAGNGDRMPATVPVPVTASETEEEV
ncbi:MAG: LapA family protein [Armatimonadetes bacterium]|nr:LapA family protein [Armatimonadota bacterium]